MTALSPGQMKVKLVPVSTKLVLSSLLDNLENHDVVSRVTGRIKGRIPEEYDDQVMLNDLLRECLVCEESELFDSVFSEAERQEFLFKLFRHLVISGGDRNQYEDIVYPYIEMAKKLYKVCQLHIHKSICQNACLRSCYRCVRQTLRKLK